MSENSQDQFHEHMRRFAAIGVALSAEKDVERILELIIAEAIDFTNSDGGTLYLADDEHNVLRFALVRNKTLGTFLGGRAGVIDWPPVPMEKDGEPNRTNVSAYCAITQEVVNIPDVYEVKDFDFSGTRAYDEKNNYRSKSMLVVPMRDHEENIIGVLQLINALDEDGKTLVEFTRSQQEIVESLASQAAVALNNAHLIGELENLFNSFITTVGTAIDEKSPYTGGHVRRVTGLTMEIAMAINGTDEGPLMDVLFDKNQLRELSISAWLHDLGKVATPESILDKAKKLEKTIDRAALIDLRYDIAEIRTRLEAAMAGVTIESGKSVSDLKKDFEEKLQELEEERKFVLSWNDASHFLDDDAISKLQRIAEKSERLTEDELENLCIRKGTLTAEERKIIEKHVVLTKKMLASLPFPKALKNVPAYAGGHHEMLDGSGYPDGLKGDEVSMQMRILTIADIFEALTAERPYKKPLVLEKAVAILKAMANQGKLDKDVMEVTTKNDVFKRYMEKEKSRE